MSGVDLAGGMGGAVTDAAPSLVARGRGGFAGMAGARMLTGGLAKDLTARVGGAATGAGADSDAAAVSPVAGSLFGAGEVGDTGEGELA